MKNYTGYLAPYRPLIAALALAGQSQRQIAELLHAGGLRDLHWWWVNSGDEWQRAAITASLSQLLRKWRQPPRVDGPPFRRRVISRHHWTAESNWMEIESLRGWNQ